MSDYVVSTYWWGNRICENSKRDFLKLTKHPVSYKTLVYRLASRCKSLGLTFYYEEYETTDDRDGVVYKPMFIRKTIERFHKPVLYIDCDIYIHRFPSLIDATEHVYDFIAFNWYADTRAKPVFDWHTLQTNSNVLYFNHTQKALWLLNEWRDAMLQNPSESDDHLLGYCFMNNKCNLNYYWFPVEYLYIPQWMKCKVNPVLSHPFYKTEMTSWVPIHTCYTHIIEYMKNEALLKCVKERNKGFKQCGLHYECKFDQPPSSPTVVTCRSDSMSPIDHDTYSFRSSSDHLLHSE